MTTEQAYAHCRELTKVAARNFYYGFVLLPQPRRDAIYSQYAFSRRADDAVDDAGDDATKAATIAGLRAELETVYGDAPVEDDPILIALRTTVRRYGIPRGHFDALLDGMEMDLQVSRYPDFAHLKLYCDRVAGSVGLASLEIFGYDDPSARDCAADLGVAMQIVNIMRDVAEDAQRDRIYLPQNEMAAHGVTDAVILAGRPTHGTASLLRAQAHRARQFFASADRLPPLLDRRARACVAMLGSTYRHILDEIENRDYDVFTERISLSTVHKLALMSRTMAGSLVSA